MIKKQCLLNDIFQPKPQSRQENTRQNNISKFIQCFNNSTGKRSRQIRILQIGNSCNTKFDHKAYSKSESMKNPPHSALLNNEILFKSHLTDARQKFFFVEGVRKKQSPKIENEMIKVVRDDKNNKRITSAQKQLSSSQNGHHHRGRGWTIQNRNLEELPKTFYIKNNHNRNSSGTSPQKNYDKSSSEIDNTKMTETSSPTNARNKTSKSVNLLNKIKTIEQYANTQPVTVNIARKQPNTFQMKKSPQEIMEEERKAKLQIKKQINIEYAKPFNPPTNISAFAYVVYEPKFSAKKEKKKIVFDKFIQEGIIGLEGNVRVQSQKKFPHSHKVIISQNSRTQVQVASLTKIMTCILAIQICHKFKLSASKQEIEIGKFESEIGGTTAQISPGQIYTLEDLYFGLMLPSGNDASVAIAVWGGRNLLIAEQKDSTIKYKKRECYNRFILQMNALCKKIGMQKTNYANSHGLVNCQNKSCAYDLGILCEYAMSNEKFRKIVSTRSYSSTIKFPSTGSPTILTSRKSNINIKYKNCDDDQVEEGEDIDLNLNEQEISKTEGNDGRQYGYKEVGWQNTHKLLQQKPNEYVGIKTGITTAAGPCLASCVKNQSGRFFIIVVLNCERMSMRFKDTQNLKRWAFQRQGLSSPKKKPKIISELVREDEQEVNSTED